MLRFLIAPAALSALPASAQDAKTGRVAGTVVSAGSGRGIAGVQIRFDSVQRVVTDPKVIRGRTKRGRVAASPVGPESCEVPGW